MARGLGVEQVTTVEFPLRVVFTIGAIGAGLSITTHILRSRDCLVLQTGTHEGDAEMRRRWSSRPERISQIPTNGRKNDRWFEVSPFE
jgi:hypothetical protein